MRREVYISPLVDGHVSDAAATTGKFEGRSGFGRTFGIIGFCWELLFGRGKKKWSRRGRKIDKTVRGGSSLLYKNQNGVASSDFVVIWQVPVLESFNERFIVL